MIEGLVIQVLQQIIDDRGKVMHMLRNDSPLFTKFGEIYFSVVNPGVVKAWKRHLKMTQNLVVPIGRIKLVLYDSRQNSTSYRNIKVLQIGEDNYCLVKIPPLLWYGFQNISPYPSLIVNCADIPHDPAEVEQLDYVDKRIPYDWNLKNDHSST